jgi:hypothetical protein
MSLMIRRPWLSASCAPPSRRERGGCHSSPIRRTMASAAQMERQRYLGLNIAHYVGRSRI